MIVALTTCLPEPVGDLLALDHAQRRIRPRLAAALQFRQPITNLIERRALGKATPGSHQAQCRNPVGPGFLRRGAHHLRVDQVVPR